MAESSERLSDSVRSINVGSAEDFDYSCEPCLTDGQHVEANGFCMDCRVHLCNTCFRRHQRTKASRNHKLLDKADIDKRDMSKTHSEMCTEKCHLHKYEVLKFFCLKHEKLACQVCVALDHRTCEIHYISDKCADIGDSEEFRQAVWLLNKRMDEVNNVKQKATKRGKEVDKYHEDLIKNIDEFQKEVNDRIQQMRKEIQAEIDKKNSLNNQTVQGVLDLCTASSSDISQLKTNLKKSKTKKQNVQLYITIKQAMMKLKADEIIKSEELLDKVDLQTRFEPNSDLQALVSKKEGFGKLTLSTRVVTPLKKQIKPTKKIDISTGSDKSLCNITGCAVLSPEKLVLADENNKKLKVLDTQRDLVVVEKKFDTSPLDVTKLPDDQIAVTFPYKKTIIIMTSEKKLSTAHTIHVKGRCRGISYHQEYLYTVCNDPNVVVILDKKGTVHNTISLNTEQLDAPYGITVSAHSRIVMYVSDTTSRRVVSITLLGEITDVSKKLFRLKSVVHNNPLGPAGMTLLDDGSLLVCCSTGSIYQLSADLKQSPDIISGLHKPCSVCYNHYLNEMYVGGIEYNKVKVFSLTFA